MKSLLMQSFCRLGKMFSACLVTGFAALAPAQQVDAQGDEVDSAGGRTTHVIVIGEAGGEIFELSDVIEVTEGACPADLDGDQIVDIVDLLTLLEQWGACTSSTSCDADFNEDGFVDDVDLKMLMRGWGSCSSSPSREISAVGQDDIAISSGDVMEPDDQACAGDLDNSQIVDIVDLLTLLEQWGVCTQSSSCNADLNEDGFVDGVDLKMLMRGWGSCSSTPSREISAVGQDDIAIYSDDVPVPDDQVCAGDLDYSQGVDIVDLLIVLEEFGPCYFGARCEADVTGDGVVDIADLEFVLRRWGACTD